MASVLTDSATALARLEAMLQYDQEPVLLVVQVQALLDEFQLAAVWTLNTVCLPDVRIVPTVPNGRWYRSIVNPSASTYTTGATEPTYWPIYVRPGGYGGYPATTLLTSLTGSPLITDGTVLWVDDGPCPVALWDLRAAAYEGWGRKAALVAGAAESYKAGSLEIANRQPIHANCLAQQKLYRRAGTL